MNTVALHPMRSCTTNRHVPCGRLQFSALHHTSIPPQPRIPRPQPPPTPRHPTRIAATTGLDSKARPRWWEAQRELWLEAHTEAQFWDYIDNGAEDFIFVDVYATWCQGCQTIYPELCRLAADPRFAGRIRFVKVCVEELKALSKQQGAKALPYVQLYRTGEHTPLVGFQAVPSRVKALRANVEAVLAAPQGKYFRIDPNGFVMVTDQPPPSKASRAAELAALKASSSGLFDHLMRVATDPSSTGQSAEAAPLSTSTPPSPAALTASSSTGRSSAEVATSLPSVAAAKAAFLEQHGSEYGYGGRIDALYPAEIGCRLPPGHHYLDYTGSSLYATSQLDAVVAELKSHVFGNPHSLNPSSQLTGDRVEEVRDMVRAWFNAPMADYQVVFTKSATDSLKLVGETFPWTKQSMFRYLRVNHNSVLGIRQYALEHAAQYESVEAPWVESWLAEGATEGSTLSEQAAEEPALSLFAFPAEDNFAGVKYPLSWASRVRAKSTPTHQWKVLIDAAAYVPTQPLDLSVVPADFVTVSFYKMFGYPTGLGALLIRTENVELLRKVFWGGGSVSLAVAGDDFRVLQCEPTSRLEDGTVAFLDIIALKHGFAMLQSLGGMTAVQAHVRCLTEWTYQQLCGLRHSNGAPLVTVFGRHAEPDARDTQGGILNFEILQDDGMPVSYRAVQEASAEAGFHLRTGSECNPGACYSYLGLTEAEVETLAEDKEGCGDEVEWITVKRPLEDDRGAVRSASVLPLLQASKLQLGHAGEIAMKWVRKPLGTVRVSLGYMSTFEDVASFVAWVRETYTDYRDPSSSEESDSK